jgi:glycosidase
MENKWWHNKVVYQIYPRSFNDTTGNGVGDIQGIIEKLDYLKRLGVDIIWLSPVYESPMKDNGYDISDYQKIDPLFGTMEDMETLIQKARLVNISIVMDLVVNHTSDQHPWFLEAKEDINSPYRDYYIWRDEPNEIESVFGGSAWAYDETTKQYYFHLFTKEQPDLNWNNPDLRQSIYDMINWWLNKGVAGFRLDVIDLIGKDPDHLITSNGPNLHKYIQEMSRQTFIPHDAITVGETWGATIEDAIQYSHPDHQELSMIFQFEHITANWHPVYNKFKTLPIHRKTLKNILYKWQTELKEGAWNSLFLNNHDLARVNSRWGNDGIYNDLSCKAFSTMIHFMKGTPYIYQGEEIGMTNVKYQHIDDYNDVEIHNRYKEYVIEKKVMTQSEFMQQVHLNGRDNARTPIQWNKSLNGGFSTGTPWLKPNSNYIFINVEDNLSNPNSVFYHYQKLIAYRKSDTYKDVITYGDFKPLNTNYDNLILYERHHLDQHLLIGVNLGETSVSFELKHDIKEILVNTGHIDYFKTVTLKAYESLVISY